MAQSNKRSAISKRRTDSAQEKSTSPNSWKKLQSLAKQETAKTDFINVQEEMEDIFLEAIHSNWTKMNPSEKKLAVQLGCLVQDLKKSLKESLKENIH